MLDVFGNYVVQKLIEFGGKDVREKILEKVRLYIEGIESYIAGFPRSMEIVPKLANGITCTAALNNFCVEFRMMWRVRQTGVFPQLKKNLSFP